MKRLAYFGIIAIIIITARSFALDPLKMEHVNIDICDFFLDSSPIANYEYMFGVEINAKAIFTDQNKTEMINCRSEYDDNSRMIKKEVRPVYYNYTISRYYEYDDNNRLISINAVHENFQKELEFSYKNNLLYEVKEKFTGNSNDSLFILFDYVLYKFDSNGNITSIYGANTSWMGLKVKLKLLKLFEYDSYNRLKSIRDFRNPENSKIVRYEEFVKNIET